MSDPSIIQAAHALIAGRTDDAEQICRAILARDGDAATAWALLSAVAADRNDPGAAIDYAQRAVAIEPGNVSFIADLGIALMTAERYDQAEQCFRDALQLDPLRPESYTSLAKLCAARGDLDSATEHNRMALAIQPDHVPAIYTAAAVHAAQRRLDEAIAGFRRAIVLMPDYLAAHSALAICYLTTGRFTEGWRHMERRKKRELPRPWRGEDVCGKVVFLHTEQGFGDSIQFLRYLPLLAERGARVLLTVQYELRRLVSRMPVEQLIDEETTVRYDYQASLMSLPAVFGTTLETIPPAPYLSGDATTWRDVLAAMPGIKIGLCWAGKTSVRFENKMADRRRSMQAQELRPLLSIPGCSFISLQLGPPAQQLVDVRPGLIRDVADRIRDFQDTADLISGLDLVISVDTAVAHLAGALGKPVWLLNRFDSCWRWLVDRSDSPWYPSMRIFRQPKPGAWAPVVDAAARDLRHLAEIFSVT